MTMLTKQRIAGVAVLIVILTSLSLFLNDLHPVTAVAAVAPVVFEASLLLLVVNVGIKYLHRRQFLKELYKSRITPQELWQMMQAGKPVVIVDLRHPLDSVTDPRVLPGAIRMLPEEIAERAGVLPRDRDIALYCT